MLDLNAFYKRSTNVVLRKLGDRQWALDMDTGSEYVLNGVSYDMLEVLSERHSVDTLLSAIVAMYDVPKDILLEDCKIWLQDTIEKGLVEKT